MRTKVLLLFLPLGLLAQTAPTPPPETYHAGELIQIVSHPDVPSYEYTIFNGVNDSYTGMSKKPLKLHENANVKFAIKGRTIYIIDEDGKVQETLYIQQAETVRVPIPK